MADVARLLPRSWDGQRLLRFLAGLAMLALAFAADAGLTAPAAAAPPPAVSTTVDLPANPPAVVASADVAPAAAAPAAAVPNAAVPNAAVPNAAVPNAAVPNAAAPAAADAAGVTPAGATVVIAVALVIGGARRDVAGLSGGTGPRAHGSRGPPVS